MSKTHTAKKAAKHPVSILSYGGIGAFTGTLWYFTNAVNNAINQLSTLSETCAENIDVIAAILPFS